MSLVLVQPKISQADQTANSTNGQMFVVQAQNATGLTSTGATLRLQSGTGTTAAGSIEFYVGATNYGNFDAALGLVLGVSAQFTMAHGGPIIKQADQTAGSTNGKTLKVQAQNATGATSTGGNLDLVSGTGTTAAGNTRLLSGATLVAQATPTTFEIATGAWLNVVKSAALGGGAAPTLGTIGGSGPTVAAQNKWVEMQSNGTTVWIPAWV